MDNKPVKLVFKCETKHKASLEKAFESGYFFDDEQSGLNILNAFCIKGTVEIGEDVVTVTAIEEVEREIYIPRTKVDENGKIVK